jgi:hypothetical protein
MKEEQLGKPASEKVHVIVVTDYGQRLWGLPDDGEAWVADTSPNHPTIRELWVEGSGRRHGITSFKVAEGESPEEWLLGILDTVELHHGEVSRRPAYSILQVSGAVLSGHVKGALQGYGFSKFEDASEGFLAYR